MKVRVDVVISLNGYIARDNGDEDWLPETGWDAFLEQIDKYQNCVVGRETYELVKEKYEHENFDAIKARMKVIVTRKKNYEISGQYTVVNSPQQAISVIKQAGLDVVYVGGGGELIKSFFEEGLVDELRLTVMPYIISSGRPFLPTASFEDIKLKLDNSERLPDGVLVNDYKVIK